MAKKKPKKKEKYVKVCPKCMSPDICLDKSDRLHPAIGLPGKYICRKCRYSGFNFPEAPLSKVGKLMKRAGKRPAAKSKNSLVATEYGEFSVRFVWKITGFILLLMGVLLILNDFMFSGIIGILVSVFMLYVAYIKKRKLKD